MPLLFLHLAIIPEFDALFLNAEQKKYFHEMTSKMTSLLNRQLLDKQWKISQY